VELLRSKFKRLTRKSHFSSTENGLGLKVDIEDCALGRQILTTSFMSTFIYLAMSTLLTEFSLSTLNTQASIS